MTAFTLFHVVLSLIGMTAGFAVIRGFLASRRLDWWTTVFFGATILTSVTGFLFPIERFTPAHALGILSLLTLGVALVSRYPKRLAGRWGTAYVVTVIISQYFNFAVLIIQSFQKVPLLQALASTPIEPASQLVFLLLFVALTVASVIRFRPDPLLARPSSSASQVVR